MFFYRSLYLCLCFFSFFYRSLYSCLYLCFFYWSLYLCLFMIYIFFYRFLYPCFYLCFFFYWSLCLCSFMLLYLFFPFLSVSLSVCLIFRSGLSFLFVCPFVCLHICIVFSWCISCSRHFVHIFSDFILFFVWEEGVLSVSLLISLIILVNIRICSTVGVFNRLLICPLSCISIYQSI